MANFRSLNTSVWREIKTLPIPEKVALIFLITNDAITYFGVTKTSAEMIADELGMAATEVEKILVRLEHKKLIIRDGFFVAVKNFFKHQGGGKISPKTISNPAKRSRDSSR